MQTLSAYCSANNIEDIDDFIYKCIKQGFDIKLETVKKMIQQKN